MRISVVQMNPGADKSENIAQARRPIGGVAVDADRPGIVSLPEVWDSLGGDRATRNANAETLPAKGSNEPGGPAYEFLRETAQVPPNPRPRGPGSSRKGRKNCSTPPWCSTRTAPRSPATARCTCSTSLPPTAPPSRHLRRRRRGRHLPADGVTAGCAICYDIRFPDLFWKLREQGADVIFLPSAFTLATGKDHWEVLLRGRAIETQCWFAAPATWGKHLEGKGEARFTYGHSLICDPWGHVVTKVSDGTGWATARIDPKVAARVRRDMPVLEHRKRV